MRNSFRKTAACAAMAVSMLGLCTIPAQAASRTPANGGYFSPVCDYGRACLRLKSNGDWYNLLGCADHPMGDYYYMAKAHGNSFRVLYKDRGAWDDVGPWVTRPLDPGNMVVNAFVGCG